MNLNFFELERDSKYGGSN